MKNTAALALLLLSGLLRASPARADARDQLDEARRSPGSYDGERQERRGGDGYYYEERRERRSELDRREPPRRRADRRETVPVVRTERESGSWMPSFGSTGAALAGVVGGIAVGFLAFAMMGTGPFGLILGGMAAIAAAVAIGVFLS
jgi:F0F1-type ATP synthase assembly protein I